MSQEQGSSGLEVGKHVGIVHCDQGIVLTSTCSDKLIFDSY
jgi:hypothetical protein